MNKNDFNIQTYDFNSETPKNILEKQEKLNDWPVVYIIHNEKEAYVGETTNVIKRLEQHLKNSERRKLNKMKVISSNTFNKSVTLDLENFLIMYMSADEKYHLQNLNNGIQTHHYYQSKEYEEGFKYIWKELHQEGLVNEENYKNLENKDIFKYSPYKQLSREQYDITNEILDKMIKDMSNNQESAFYIEGGPGTGKSILAIYLMKRLNDMQRELDEENEFISSNTVKLKEMLKREKKDKLKIGFVIPMQSFRKTIQQVFKKIDGLQVNMVISPFQVINSEEEYDILIVDESHRLSKRNSTRSAIHKSYFEEYGTQLDWIKKKSKHQIFFYDRGQAIRSADIGKNIFSKEEKHKEKNLYQYQLKSQFRCMAGDDYIEYIRELFSDNPPKKEIDFNKKNYEFYLFDDVNEMVQAIKQKNKKYKLCRNLAGYAWPWNKGKNDIKIGKYSYKWNTTNIDFINSKNAINEIGCIHTSQGYDLNYAGIIIGNDIKYDTINKKIVIDKLNYYDRKGKQLTDYDDLKEYIINIYNVLLTRGINGTYVYVCDENLKEYLSKYIPKWKHYTSYEEEDRTRQLNLAADNNEEYKV